MIHFYLDSSAVLKRYMPEVGTAWIVALTDFSAGHTVILSEITLVESAAALASKHRATKNYRLRGYDAVQLATALDVNATLVAGGLASLTFVAADNDLIAAARGEGLHTENPNLHP